MNFHLKAFLLSESPGQRLQSKEQDHEHQGHLDWIAQEEAQARRPRCLCPNTCGGVAAPEQQPVVSQPKVCRMTSNFTESLKVLKWSWRYSSFKIVFKIGAFVSEDTMGRLPKGICFLNTICFFDAALRVGITVLT